MSFQFNVRCTEKRGHGGRCPILSNKVFCREEESLRGNADGEQFFDVVLQSTGFFTGSYQDWENFPPPQNDFCLGADFWIGTLPQSVKSETVLDACEPAGFNFRPIRQFGCRYAF